ncbi:Transcription factor GTE9 [Apostasia shenzhenica]|uniref:Transcription factor GTE9 n=1 Tax=Apostasia shenzhenica TaxID=1088818 RepID=A0A2I0B3G5_9ASPA|nr:Transcription factor GTE9 [Apostasia shenzhenica]
MTQTVTKNCSWSQGKASKELCHNISFTSMGKTQKDSKGYSSSIVPEYRHAVEAVGESEGLVSPGHVGSEMSCTPKRRCISLNADRYDGFCAPMQVVSFSKMSGPERKVLEMRLRQELEMVQIFQKKIRSTAAVESNAVAVSSSSDHPPIKKLDHPVQNASHLKRGITGRFESTKQAPGPPSVTVLIKQCESLLKRLMAHQYAWVFNTPVDVVKLNIPDYFSVIKQPMDLGTVKSKLASNLYSSPWDFASDVRLTFSNAMTYNPPGNDVHIMADVMSKFFEMRWKPIEKKLKAADAIVRRETVATKTVSKPWKSVPQEDNNKHGLENKSKMNDEEKLSLSRRLSLIPELPQHIVDFLKRHCDNTNQYSEEEIEIDFDSLSDDALFELKNLLDDYSQGNLLEQQEKMDLCEIEILNESGLSNSSTHPGEGVGPVDEDEDVDIGGNDLPVTGYSPVDTGKVTAQRIGKGSSSSSSSSGSGSSSDSDSSSTSRSESNIKVAGSTISLKETGPTQAATIHDRGHVSVVDQLEQDSCVKIGSVKANNSQEGENAPSERQVSPDKLYRAALLRSRFADTILKAREKTLDQGKKKDPENLRREREELERQQREERARLQAEAKAAEDARRQAEAKAAAEAKRRRELEREAARQALLQMEKTVEINENSLFLKDLEMLRTAPAEHTSGDATQSNLDCSNEGIDGFKLGGNNPLEQLGLYMKVDDDEEDEVDVPSSVPMNDVEEGEID